MEGKLHIDGSIDGNIFSEGFISIGKNGKASGQIQADKVMVSGYFEGNILCNSIEIMETGKVVGEICSNELIIEPKGLFLGTSKLLEKEENALTKKMENTQEKAETKKGQQKNEKSGK
ncbi:bactofilin family protein [Hydrogenimonas sp.]